MAPRGRMRGRNAARRVVTAAATMLGAACASTPPATTPVPVHPLEPALLASDTATPPPPAPVRPAEPVDDPLAYSGWGADGRPRYLFRWFSDYDRALLKWAWGIDDPRRLWRPDSAPGTVLLYVTAPQPGAKGPIGWGMAARVGHPAARWPGETWEGFAARVARLQRGQWPRRAFATYASLEALAPEARGPFTRLVTEARRAGFRVQVRETYRTPERQAMLLARGDGSTFTPTSWHTSGRAADLVIGDGDLRDARTRREWIAFRRWILEHAPGQFELIGTPDDTWDWPHVELATGTPGFRTVTELLAAARACASGFGATAARDTAGRDSGTVATAATVSATVTAAAAPTTTLASTAGGPSAPAVGAAPYAATSPPSSTIACPTMNAAASEQR